MAAAEEVAQSWERLAAQVTAPRVTMHNGAAAELCPAYTVHPPFPRSTGLLSRQSTQLAVASLPPVCRWLALSPAHFQPTLTAATLAAPALTAATLAALALAAATLAALALAALGRRAAPPEPALQDRLPRGQDRAWR